MSDFAEQLQSVQEQIQKGKELADEAKEHTQRISEILNTTGETTVAGLELLDKVSDIPDLAKEQFKALVGRGQDAVNDAIGDATDAASDAAQAVSTTASNAVQAATTTASTAATNAAQGATTTASTASSSPSVVASTNYSNTSRINPADADDDDLFSTPRTLNQTTAITDAAEGAESAEVSADTAAAGLEAAGAAADSTGIGAVVGVGLAVAGAVSSFIGGMIETFGHHHESKPPEPVVPSFQLGVTDAQ